MIKALLQQIDDLLKQPKSEHSSLAIDGMSAAGKSTLAADLSRKYNCNLVTMDDFFLRPEQRTPERYSEIGGNIDYERFNTEIIANLKSGKTFSYRPFCCKTMKLTEPVTLIPTNLTIIEGVYSMHPYFTEQFKYDLTVFMQISETEQLNRLKKRSPLLIENYIKKWIPMENRYFNHFHIKENSNFIIEGNERV
ncbi:MAG: hypothetical protein LBC73_06425 [Oscillospiraceae bacterium]|jgi:uridine kinase|nr:hypothetical protein [Oscillospiraceae bacterium]